MEFAILKLNPQCRNVDEIKRAYQQRLLECQYENDRFYTKEFQTIENAYKQVLNHVKKIAMKEQQLNFNAKFEYVKAQQKSTNKSTNLQAFDALSADFTAYSTVAEDNGLLMLKPQDKHDSLVYGDVKEFEREYKETIPVNFEKLDDKTLDEYKRRYIESYEKIISEKEKQCRLYEYNQEKLPRNELPIWKAEKVLLEKQKERLMKDKEEARKYIVEQRLLNPELYPANTWKKYDEKTLDRFRI